MSRSVRRTVCSIFSIALMAFSSLRPESLGDYLGKDGLKLGDFRDVEIKPKMIEFKKIPVMLVIRRNLSKARFQYFTFVPEEGLTYIREYLDGRTRAGERLDDKTRLLYFDGRGNRKNEFLRTTLITRDIKEAIQAAHFSWRPYVLRSYSATEGFMKNTPRLKRQAHRTATTELIKSLKN